MTDLSGRVALITGAGRGIGAATAQAFSAAGAAVAVAARRLEDAEGVAATLPGPALPLGCDVADGAAVDAAVAAVLARFGRLDVLVNNAGTIAPIGRVGETAPEAWAHALAVNLTGAYRAARAALPALLAAPGGGAIVNIGSGAALRPLEGWSAYCAAKAGLVMLTRCLDLEYGDQGLRAVAFAPGLVDTGMQESIRRSGMNPVSALPRAALAPATEPARAIVWLAGKGGAAWRGQQADIRDPALRAGAGLPPLPEVPQG